MHNPSHPLPFRGGAPDELTAREVVAFTSLSVHWAGRSAGTLARDIATALDTALHPGVVVVTLDDPDSGETVMAVNGRLRDQFESAEQWAALLKPWRRADAAGDVHLVALPSGSAKLKLLVACIGLECARGYIVLVSDDPAFPRQRDDLLLEVASHQASLAFAGLCRSRAMPVPVARERSPEDAPGRAFQASLQTVADAMPALIAYVDRDHIYRFANQCYKDWFGLEPSEILGRHVADVLGADVYETIRSAMERAVAGERTHYEARLSYQNGPSRYVHGVYVPDRTAAGEVRGFFALVQDVTDRKRAEQSLKESEERFRNLADTAPVLMWMTDEHKRSVYFNKRWLEFLGQSFDQAIAEDWSQYVHPDDRDACLGHCLSAFEAHIPFTMDFRMRRHDGVYRWVNDTALPRFDPDGTFRGFIGAMVDITERKELEEERAQALTAEREARAEAELLRDLGNDLNSKLELQAMLQRVTDAATAAVGAGFGAFFYNATNEQGESYTLYTLSGAPREAFAKFSLPRNTALFGPTFRGEGVVRCDDVTRDPRYGKSAPYHGMPPGHLPVRSYLAVPVKSRSDEVIGGLFFGHAEPGRFRERHERVASGVAAQAAVAIDNVRLFDAVRDQARRLLATYDHAPIGIAEAAPDGRFVRVNDRFCAITGYSRDELLHMRFVDVTHPDDVALSETPYRDLVAGNVDSYNIEKRYRRKQGDVIWVRVTVASMRNAQGRHEHGVGVVEDITERRRAEIVFSGQKHALEQMARGETFAAVLQTLIDTFERQSTIEALSAVSLLDKDAGVLRPIATRRLPAAWVEALRETPVGPDHAPGGAAAASGGSVFVPDISREPRWESYREIAASLGFRAAWSLCLRGGDGRVLGTFDILCREPLLPTADELRFVELIADTVAVAVERHESERALQSQAQVLSRIHDAVVMVDVAGRVLQWNEGAARMFGFTPAEALGRNLSQLCAAPDDYRWLEQHVIAPLRREGRIERVAPLRRRSGELVHALLSLSLLRDDDGEATAMVAYILDVSQRVRAERELAVRVRQQEAVAKLGQLALSGTDLQDLMNQTVRLAAGTLDVEFAKVLELLPSGEELLLRAGVGWQDGLVGRGTVSAGRASQAGYTLLANEPVVVTDLRSETRFSGPPLLHDHGVVGGMSVVVPGEAGRHYGVIGVHTAKARSFSSYDVNFLQSVAHVLASAIQRRRFEAALHQAREDLERRVEERTTELARTNQSLRDEVVERMGVENALRESEAQYRMLFERNPLPAWVFDIHTRNVLAVNETAVWQYGYTREEFLRMNIHDLHPQDEASRALDYTEQFPPETAYIGVWRHRKQDETVIDVEVFVYEVLFQGRWARLMLANDITERRRTEQEFRLLETITRSVSEARDLDAALYAILRHICETTGWLFGEAWLPTPDGMHLRCSRAWYYGAEGLEEFRHSAWELELRRGEGLVGRAWATGQPIWVADVTADETFVRASAARTAQLHAGIAFPVVAESEIVALFAFFLREPRLEDEHQVKLVATIATQAGLAIQRKRAEERLRESEERFRLLVEGAHDYAIFMLDPDGCVASWNRGAERLKGYTAEEVIGQPVALFYTAEDVARELPQRMLARARGDGVYEAEGWRVRKDGERFWANVTVTALHDSASGLRGFVKVTRDVTERKQAEERLRESEARLARAQEFSLLMVAHVGLDGRWLKVPQMLCATLAYHEEELLAGRFQDVTHADDFPAEWEECSRLIRGEAKSFDLEKRFLRRDGKIIWVYQNTSIVLDAQDCPLHFLTFIRDITQRKEAEEQLRRSEIQLSEAQRLAHLGSWEWDVVSGRVEWSDELYRIYGIPLGAPVTYETYLELVHPEDRDRVSRTIAAALESRQPFTLEERIARPDGELRYLLSHGAVVAGPRGGVARMVGVCLDITERKRAEERLRDSAHRLESLSQRLLEAQETERRRIARELHDQIGQDLSVIKINLQALQRLPGGTALAPHLDETVRIVEGVLTTARNLSVELRPSMLDDLGLVAALRWYLDRQVQRTNLALHFVVNSFEFRLAPAIETACFRLAQEALTNILRHADARHVNVTLQTSGQELELRVVDDGKGFDVEAARARASRGESFGLLGMEERALLAGGRLEIVSNLGHGTTVIARFPLTLKTVHTL